MVAVDSGDNSSHEAFQASARHAFQGRCVVLIKTSTTTGRLTLTASAPGLADGTLMLEATIVAPR